MSVAFAIPSATVLALIVLIVALIIRGNRSRR